MKLYLIQHARAATKQEDTERPLTQEGFSDIHKIAGFLTSLDIKVDYLWHSGKKRAAQTAEVLAKVIEIENQVATRESLGPNDDVTILKNQIISDRKDIMIVGHMPFVSKLASLLLTGSESAGTVAFRQGGVVCLNYTDDQIWQVEWMIIPDMII